MRRRFANNVEHPYIALTASQFAWWHLYTGKHDDAEPLFTEALKIYRTRFGRKHPNVVSPLLGLGCTLLARGEVDRADQVLQEARSVARDALPEHHWLASGATSAWGECLTVMGRFEEAEPRLLQGYEDMLGVRGETDRHVQTALARIVTLYEKWGKTELADKFRVKKTKDGDS